MKIISLLLEEGVIDKKKAKDLEKELKKKEHTEEEIILKEGVISENDLFELKSRELKIPLKKIEPDKISEEIFDFFSEELMTQYKLAPFFKEGRNHEIGMVYPEDIKAQESLRFLARQDNFEYKIFLITISGFNEVLKKYRTLKRETGRALKELEEAGAELKPQKEEADVLEEITEEAPVVKIISTILEHATGRGASDIHIELTQSNLRFRFRIDGVLYSVLNLPPNLHSAVVSRIKIMANLKIDETRLPQDGRFSKEVRRRQIDFRVSTFPTSLKEKIAIRILDPETGLKNYKELGLIKKNLEIVREFIKKPYGLILVVGPTGCGKTTTLYAFLRELNKETLNVVSIEDPIEYFIDGVNQSQVKPDIKYTFANALRHIVRQDPNVIMVGEIRDNETASLAIHAGLTGHIVLSTLHTNNAIGVIPRLIDMEIQPFLISSALSLIIAQRLIRVLCPNCKKRSKPSPEIQEFILKQIESLPKEIKEEAQFSKNFEIYFPQGCPKCNSTGYSGRTGVFEALKITDSLAQTIIEKPTQEKLEKEAENQSMITMTQDGILKVLSGETSIEEVLRISEEI